MGFDPKDPLCQISESYLERGGRRLETAITPVAEAKRKKANDTEHRAFEAEKLLAASDRCFRIALDAGGKNYSSESFAKYLSQLQNQGHRVAFLIGGPTGLSEDIKNKADNNVAFGHDITSPAGFMFFIRTTTGSAEFGGVAPITNDHGCRLMVIFRT